MRFLAASMKIESWPRIFSCPTYSSRRRGRSARSTTSSCTPATLAVTRRLSSSFSIATSDHRLREQLQRLADAVADGDALGQLLDRRDRFLVAVAQREQRVEDVGRRRRRAVDADGGRHVRAELVLELEQQALGGLLADARNLGEPARILHRHRLRELGDREAGEHRQRGARADAADLHELPERAPLAARCRSRTADARPRARRDA